MGSIRKVYNPEYWKILKEGKSKICEGDTIYIIEIGYIDDYPQSYEMVEYISKINHEKLLNKELKLVKTPYSETPIHLYKENEEVPLIINKKILKPKIK